ncbi:MAG: multicomponent Na+:H+ antiporter subunit [Thermotogota bacterium]|nr:multicomponent Na+:H+ antiporter subunit [Thermotogota bacterium]
MSVLSAAILYTGVFFWLFGTLYLFSKKAPVTKLHFLGISDTLGSFLIVLGLIAKSPEMWRPLTLVLVSAISWGPVLTHMIARAMIWKRRF